ncbi:Gfo/Idh/MocA family protein [Alteribacillus bidgolensis]|uniref:Predicted dehydrogenase n=1 Tax=Alteribacillus bidgolensis TaxID=930129 RepID=A0A1G8K8U5_9BACI|nr:Gfo/Idh/MocA family oxidoreductase [Alteribacillus bidgolensis]SDI39779.1 Predicted dehydrogenase [Alteribacillus bidgolensis]
MKVRIGLIGAGWMGKAHSNAFRHASMLFGPEAGEPVFEIVQDIDAEAAKAACHNIGFSRWTENWEDVVRDENVDMVDIATPNAFHYDVARAALENGKHVYCEKPLTISPKQSKELAILAKEKGVVNYVGFNNVMNPANNYIKELIDSGKLGEIKRFSGTYDQDALLDETIKISWRHINKFSGSGSLGDLGSHLLSVAQYWFGDAKKVNAVSETIIKERPKAPDSLEKGKVENDDFFFSMIKYENGVIGTIGSSRVAPGRKNHLTYEIQGTQGTAYYSLENLSEVHVYFHSDESADRGFRKVLLGTDHQGYSAFYPQSGIAIGFNDLKVIEVHEIFTALKEGKVYTCDFEFGWKVDRTIDAILRSAAVEQWVPVE